MEYDELHHVFRLKEGDTEAKVEVVSIDKIKEEYEDAKLTMSQKSARKLISAGGLVCSDGCCMVAVLEGTVKPHFRHDFGHRNDNHGDTSAPLDPIEGCGCLKSRDHIEAQIKIADYINSGNTLSCIQFKTCGKHSHVCYTTSAGATAAIEVYMGAGLINKKKMFMDVVIWNAEKQFERVLEVWHSHKTKATDHTVPYVTSTWHYHHQISSRAHRLFL